MKRTIQILATGLALLFFSGCGATTVNTAKLKTMHRVALVSVTLDKVGQSAGDEKIQNKAVTYSNTVYNQELTKVPGWQLVPAPGIAELDRNFSDLESSKIARDVLLEMAENNELPGKMGEVMIAKLMIASFKGDTVELEKLKTEAIAGTIEELQADLDQLRANFSWADGTAGIPHYLVNDEGKAKALRTIRSRVLEDYRQQHNLDGVIIVHQRTRAGTPGDIRVITQQDRVLSSLKLNPQIVVRAFGGEVVYDSGSPRLDDLAPMELAMPIYRGDVSKGSTIKNLRIDLDDPKGVALKGYWDLVNETAPDLVADMIKEMQKK